MNNSKTTAQNTSNYPANQNKPQNIRPQPQISQVNSAKNIQNVQQTSKNMHIKSESNFKNVFGAPGKVGGNYSQETSQIKNAKNDRYGILLAYAASSLGESLRMSNYKFAFEQLKKKLVTEYKTKKLSALDPSDMKSKAANFVGHFLVGKFKGYLR